MQDAGNLFPRYAPGFSVISAFLPVKLAAWCLFHSTKLFIMDKMQQLEMMDKISRELDDLKNSQTSVLKKITQIEAENINLGVQLLEQALPDVHESIDKGIEDVAALLEKFQAHRTKFAKDNKLEPAEAVTN